MRTLFLKNIDKFIGNFLIRCFPGPSGRKIPRSPDKFLFIRPGGIGDAVLLIPALRAVASTFTNSRIDILAETRNSEIFNLCDCIAHIYNYDHPAEFAACIKGKYDVIIDTEQWHRLSAIVTRIVHSKSKIGFSTNNRARAFSYYVDYSHADYEALSFFNLLAPLGISTPREINVPFLDLPAKAVSRAKNLLGLLYEQDFIVIFPGASIRERRWSVENFADLAECLNKQEKISIVVVGGKEDRYTGEQILQNIKGLNLAGRTNLAETAAIIDQTSVLISGDSGVLHIAVGLNVPTVSLFGPGIADKWAPKGNHHIVINRRLHCSPCTRFGNTRPCSKNAPCIQEITMQKVFAAVKSLLGHN